MAFKMNPKSPALKSMGRYATPQAIKPAVTSPAKQMGVDPGETAAFEKSKAIELAAEEKMERAKGNKKKQAQIIKNTRKKQAAKVPKAKAKGNKEGYTPFGESKKIPAKSPAKQKVNRDDGVQVKEVPKVVGEEVEKATKFVGKEAKKVSKWGKKLFKKIGNIKLTKTKKEKLEKAEEKVSKLKTKTKQ